ncbi:uncharacterized protein LOC113366447 [Ctenocephalides felis]|uniref:uncharacterized protein LOC113366447 n=1 Tax=Ctenocephalides felis TaxID=7515 RepID=UPI000E6E46E3|nr:uncharacterized protein LOC113366447 [Ctenocephalides felis]
MYMAKLLLVNVPGSTSFQQLKTVDGHLCATYRKACHMLQLLKNDSHWDNTLKDAIYPHFRIKGYMCLLMPNKILSCLGLTAPNRCVQDAFHHELRREQQYDIKTLTEIVRTTVPKLNDHQRIQNNVALALALLGIAATLLEDGHTAHSALKLPLNMQINETPVCNIRKTSAMAKILQTRKLIIWDKCTMAHKRSLEALDKTLKDLRNFRQTLPVIPRSTVADELNACLKSSNLWRHVKKLQLTTNMRVVLQQGETAKVFSKQLLNIGNGECFTYKSVDTATNQDDILNYPTEFLNSLELPGLPPHNLQLKVRSVVIMLRNLNQPILCNDTRLL